MNVEIGAEAAQFPKKEYINGIAVAVYLWLNEDNSKCRRWLEISALTIQRQHQSDNKLWSIFLIPKIYVQ
jgi:hypothetical protein